MKRLLLAIPLLVFISPVNAFWGLSEEEKSICRDRASRERNEFSAKQTYNYCLKNIKSESNKKKEKEKKRDKFLKNDCQKEKKAVDKCEWKSYKKCEKWHKQNPDWIPLSKENSLLNLYNRCPYSSESSCKEKYESRSKCEDRLKETKKEYGL